MDIDKSKHNEKSHCLCEQFLSEDIAACDGEVREQTTNGSNHILKQESVEQSWKNSLIIQPKDPNLVKVFIIKRIGDEEGTDITIKIISILNTYKTKVYVEENSVEDLKNKSHQMNVSYHGYTEDQEMNIDLLIIVGGDGSILWALQYFHHRVTPPVLAFSKGTLNYLCNFSIQHYEESIKKVMDSIFEKKPLLVEIRARLHCEISNKTTGKKRTLEALNEVSLDRGCSPNIVRLNSYLEGKYFATFEGDGVLVATPTGSTAYQLSAGGPILNHLMNSFVVTPISSLNLSTRPVVLPSKAKLTFKIHPEGRKSAFLGADGQVKLEITKDTEVLICGSKFYAPFILGDNQDTLDNWITRLRDLLGWNRKHYQEKS